MSKENESIIVGAWDDTDINDYGREVVLNGGLFEINDVSAISKLRWSKPKRLVVGGSTTGNCVARILKFALKDLKVEEARVLLHKCRRNRTDVGDFSNLKERRVGIEEALGDLANHPNLIFEPDIK